MKRKNIEDYDMFDFGEVTDPEDYADDVLNFIASHKKLEKARGYKLAGVRDFQGLKISVEHNKGGVRTGVDKDGHEWKTKMHYAYGGIRGTKGNDGDYVDCYLGDNDNSTKVFIVHQNDPVTHKYDEDKVMLGFSSAKEAKDAYLKQYDRPGFFGSMDETDMEHFKEMLKTSKGVRLKKSLSDMNLEKAKKAKALTGQSKFDYVMSEFAKGNLKSSDGSVVTDKDQAVAIAYSESGMSKSKKEVGMKLYNIPVVSPTELVKGMAGTRGIPDGSGADGKGCQDKGQGAGKGRQKLVQSLKDEGTYVEGQPKVFTAEQAQQGIRVEMEHTNDLETAKQIAYDHLAENPEYYSYLEEMEAKMEARKSGEHKLVLSKGREMPIGTVSHGRKKVAKGKWVPVKSEKKGNGNKNELDIIKNSLKMSSWELIQKFKHYTKVGLSGAKGRFDYSTDAFSDDNALTYVQKLNKKTPDYIQYKVHKLGNSSSISVYLKTNHSSPLFIGDWRISKDETKKSLVDMDLKKSKDSKLEEYKKVLLDFLQGKDEIKKSRGYSAGTIREWNGKQYKKMANGKWMRYYEGKSGTKGMDQAVRNTVKKIQNASSMEELAEIIKNNSSRFKGADGRTAEVVKDLMSQARGTEAGKKEKKAATPKTKKEKLRAQIDQAEKGLAQKKKEKDTEDKNKADYVKFKSSPEAKKEYKEWRTKILDIIGKAKSTDEAFKALTGLTGIPAHVAEKYKEEFDTGSGAKDTVDQIWQKLQLGRDPSYDVNKPRVKIKKSMPDEILPLSKQLMW